MPTWAWIALALAYTAGLIFLLALGSAAARADRLSEEAITRLHEEKEDGSC